MAVEDENPRVREIKGQLDARLDALKGEIQTGRKVEALTSVAWIRTRIDELLCNLGCNPLSEDDALTDPGEFRIVQKIQDLGPGGEYSAWGATPVPEVPEPATGLLLLAGLAVAARTGLARRRSKA